MQVLHIRNYCKFSKSFQGFKQSAPALQELTVVILGNFMKLVNWFRFAICTIFYNIIFANIFNYAIVLPNI